MDQEPIAHINENGECQSLSTHLLNTAELAAAMASVFHCEVWGYLAGLWHDIGKYSNEFQKKIWGDDGKNAHIESPTKVDHSTAGAQHAHRTLVNKHFGKIIAYAIAGHHGGIPDGISNDSCLRSRLHKNLHNYENCPPLILEPKEISLLSLEHIKLDNRRAGVQIALLIRMLYSCLVDADFLDTEAFMNPEESKLRQGYKTLPELADKFFTNLEEFRENALSSSINKKRETVLNQCLAAAEKNMGFFSLTVPTGGGKTLSSMAFAFRHAIKHQLNRIIYVIPYTSIIEQNAEVFRQFCGENAIIEHHSNFDAKEEDYRSRLAAENWDAPIIVTTNVQFFESLFANRSSRCRKLHNIAKSVIILDEVQTLPPDYLLPCLETLKELVLSYRATIVLCSATQPAVQRRQDFALGLENVCEIIDNPQELAKELRRTEIILLNKVSDEELANRLLEYQQALCIVNTRSHARNLFQSIEDKEGAIHLSALMCPVHRSQKIREIHDRLKNNHPCRVVSTQVVEAGVDIDFPVVFRAIAGIDSIAQAAGRCNREGKLKSGRVFVFVPEIGIPPGHLRQTTQTAESVIRRFADDILSLEAIEDYFKNLFWLKGEALDKKRILAKLSEGIQKGDFPFRSVAEEFRFIDDITIPVVIPYDEEARSLIYQLEYSESKLLARKLQRYTVAVYPNEYDALLKSHCIETIGGLFAILRDEMLYDKNTGLSTDALKTRDPESLIA